ncbi:Phosphotransferase [Bibersteinia trehalosi USDA-ARS-USMARC-188]|uniref:Phosphotransferase n=3 Tax=Bibersteinia trehalosi TaxID=47735 RepID=A0A4V7I6U9_BIBTR|nr:PTS sugar transporter subunit IIB [Bibersteinia trehalosi]AGH39527.1 Phosphotransferase [Bibersteinia trehalosi USDA-ARS-USMARC-192]AHG80729.1 Phosphotransferase [Bibersteinia trehalosi USDA-ARS-USMARC-188]AHG82876.1 Phosphotransferase [Bibersteinia trehalosi USDA-ARS-USMARC-189]RRN05384.1 PTS sugar transporter subunit IIB [Bibersteinia trehalosi]TCT16528.1 glucose-like phosphotransferase system IIB component [Bibersteinia trehalosi]
MSVNVQEIIYALGGVNNIKQVDACLTRLRVKLNDNHALNKSTLKKLGAVDVVKVGDTFQIIFGVESAKYRDAINLILTQ